MIYGAVEADPYPWPYDGAIDPAHTALIRGSAMPARAGGSSSGASRAGTSCPRSTPSRAR